MRRWGLVAAIGWGGAASAIAWAGPAQAGPRVACDGGAPFVAEVVALGGAVTVAPLAGGGFAAALGDLLCPGDRLGTGPDGRVEMQFAGADTTVGIGRNASVRLAPGDADVRLESGLLRFISSVRGVFAVDTQHANAGIDGTEAVLALDRPGGDLAVLVVEGTVTLRAMGGALALGAGAAGVAGLGTPPRPPRPGEAQDLLADPAGAADWAIHYPPMLVGAGGVAGQAAALLDAGDPDGAEALLAGAAPDPGALALRSLIASLRGRAAQAAALANQAVALDPGFGPGWVAASYAAQAAGDIDAARTAAARAVAVAPGDAFAAARRAELSLIAGDRAGAIAQARAANALGTTALGQAVLGLARLASNDPGRAQAAFGAAIAIDSRAPLAHLGRGLALIRQGQIGPGRRALELAVALDPRRAATRSWLGRAYATEGDAAKAQAQFDLAKARDPDDPTPWLLAAQELYAANSPVEALAEIEASAGRGDARATVRGASGLAEDRAVNAAALSRILATLGFDQRAEAAGARAVEADPTNPAAQRQYAAGLGDAQGRDIARASAHLTALAYEGPAKTPIEAGQIEAGLGLLDTPGAARASFAEFAPFFDQDGVRVDATAGIGTQGTVMDQASFTALADRFSIGLGQFHYQTDGYRADNAVTHDVAAVQAKAELAPWLDVFGEYRYRDSTSGDRLLEFDLVADDPDLTATDQRNTARAGFHATLGADHDLVGVLTYARQTAVSDRRAGFFDSTETLDRSGTEIQGQHAARWGGFALLSGASFARIDDRSRVVTAFGDTADRARADVFTAYSYGTLTLADPGPLAAAALTLGLSYDAVSSATPGLSQHRINPKLGARVALTDDLVLRAAYTETIKPPQFLEQRLEPMSVAGFEQYLDEFEGAELAQLAVGLDWRALPWAWVGVEAALREIDQPVGGGTPVGTDARVLRGYVNATFGPRMAGALSLTHEASSGSDPFDLADFEATEALGRLTYHHPSGLFGAVELGYVWHDAFTFQGQDDDFPLVGGVLGYRLPDRRGVLSLAVQNAPDARFGFVDRPGNSRGDAFAPPRFAPELTVFLQATVGF